MSQTQTGGRGWFCRISRKVFLPDNSEAFICFLRLGWSGSARFLVSVREQGSEQEEVMDSIWEAAPFWFLLVPQCERSGHTTKLTGRESPVLGPLGHR